MNEVTDEQWKRNILTYLGEVLSPPAFLREQWVVNTDRTVFPLSNEYYDEEPWVPALGCAIQTSSDSWYVCSAYSVNEDCDLPLYRLSTQREVGGLAGVFFGEEFALFSPALECMVVVTPDDYALKAGSRNFVNSVCGSYHSAINEYSKFSEEYRVAFRNSALLHGIMRTLDGVGRLARLGGI